MPGAFPQSWIRSGGGRKRTQPCSGPGAAQGAPQPHPADPQSALRRRSRGRREDSLAAGLLHSRAGQVPIGPTCRPHKRREPQRCRHDDACTEGPSPGMSTRGCGLLPLRSARKTFLPRSGGRPTPGASSTICSSCDASGSCSGRPEPTLPAGTRALFPLRCPGCISSAPARDRGVRRPTVETEGTPCRAAQDSRSAVSVLPRLPGRSGGRP